MGSALSAKTAVTSWDAADQMHVLAVGNLDRRMTLEDLFTECVVSPVIKNSNGIDIDTTDGGDGDVDLLTCLVTGTPKLSWSETADVFSLSKGLDITGTLHITDRVSIGAEDPAANIGLRLPISFTASGNSFATGFDLDPIIQMGAGETAYANYLNVTGRGLTTQAGETIGSVSSVRITEPQITLGAGAHVDVAATVLIVDAPTEATSNAALWVNSGMSYFADYVNCATFTQRAILNVGANIAINAADYVDDFPAITAALLTSGEIHSALIGGLNRGYLRLSAGGGEAAGLKSGIDILGYTGASQNAVRIFTAGAERLRVDSAGNLITTANIGAAAGTGVAATEYGTSVVHQTVLTFTAHSVTINDPTGAAGYGASKVYDFPEGSIVILSAVANLTLTAGAGGISDTFNGDFAVGTVGTADSDFGDAGEATVIASTATPAASGGVSSAKGQSTASLVVDGTTTAADLYLNLLVDDGDISAADTIVVGGTLTITWVKAGDY